MISADEYNPLFCEDEKLSTYLKSTFVNYK